jgi:cytochrome c biogenesis protein CcmG/thiol:disulfide interchange protein DsbE
VIPLNALAERPKRSMTRRLVIALLPAMAFVGLLWAGLSRSGSTGVAAGSRAPDFDLPRLDRQGSLSSSDLKGSPVVVNFWASWCIPCREEAPVLERTWRRYGDRGVVVLGVNIKDGKTDAKEFLNEFDITYPAVRDVNQELARALGVRGIPETFFIDHEWRFLRTLSGARQDEEGGTVVLGAISEEELVTTVEVLLRRAESEAG